MVWKLMTKRDVGLISGFWSKTGKSCKAHQVLADKNRMVLLFEQKPKKEKMRSPFRE